MSKRILDRNALRQALDDAESSDYESTNSHSLASAIHGNNAKHSPSIALLAERGRQTHKKVKQILVHSEHQSQQLEQLQAEMCLQRQQQREIIAKLDDITANADLKTCSNHASSCFTQPWSAVVNCFRRMCAKKHCSRNGVDYANDDDEDSEEMVTMAAVEKCNLLQSFDSAVSMERGESKKDF